MVLLKIISEKPNLSNSPTSRFQNIIVDIKAESSHKTTFFSHDPLLRVVSIGKCVMCRQEQSFSEVKFYKFIALTRGERL